MARLVPYTTETPAPKKAGRKKLNGNGAALGFEEKLWAAADKMRGHLDPAEYKHVVLGLVFLKYISDAFEERYHQLALWTADSESDWYIKEPGERYLVVEDRDAYLAENVFWVPAEARWSFLQANAKQPTIGRLIDDAMVAIERENPSLKGVLPKNYGRQDLDKQRLGELIDLIGTIGLGDEASRSKDVLGRVYEYFLGRFASAEGKGGGEFYTPQVVVKLLVEMIEPYRGRVYDPCCGSGGMFVQSEKFVLAHGGRLNDLAIYGQESNPTTWRLCKMNLAIRGIEGNLGPQNADSFHNDLHKDLKADYILANPPFNVSDWGGERLRDDARWKYGAPPAANANFAWVEHMVHHLAPSGVAGFVLANGSMSSNTGGEGDIRRALVEADLVDCMIALPGQLFYTTQIPVCLWFLTRTKAGVGGTVPDRTRHDGSGGAPSVGALLAAPFPALPRDAVPGQSGAGQTEARERARQAAPLQNAPQPRGQAVLTRDRRGQTLFIDARKLGYLVDRTHRELTDDEIARVARTYHAWRGEPEAGAYADVPGFCKSATTEEIKAHGYVLTPGRYVGAADVEDDSEPFEAKMARLVATLEGQFAESVRLEAAIRENLRGLGYGC